MKRRNCDVSESGEAMKAETVRKAKTIKAKKVRRSESYWEEAWTQGVDNGAMYDDATMPAKRRERMDVMAKEKMRGSPSRPCVPYQAPLGFSFIDPEFAAECMWAVELVIECFGWLPARVRSLSQNRPAEFLRLYSTVEGRAKLMAAGLRLFDDNGLEVDARGRVFTREHGPVGLRNYRDLLGDPDVEPVPLTAKKPEGR